MAYQKPSNPAPVSGPGRFARRTDGGPGGRQAPVPIPGGAYGDGVDMMEVQSGAPMAASAPVQQQAPAAPPAAPPEGIDLFAPTQRPDEPVTAGAALGPGPGMEALPRVQRPRVSEVLTRLAVQSGDPQIAAIAAWARGRGR
jgi:hypothetical protein